MSGHSKWATIKRAKGAADAKRGQMFTKFSKEITMAARDGGKDPEMNPRLRSAVTAARAANMPNDNVERAILKGTGELGGAVMEELSYEGYAAGGVAVIVNCLSDNRNRTAADIRAIFNKHDFSMANSGAVSWKFHRKAKFLIEGENADEEKLFELLLDGGADVEDISVEEGFAEISAPANAFGDILKIFEDANVEVSESAIDLIPENTTVITDLDIAKRVKKFLDIIEDYDDVQEVFNDMEYKEKSKKEIVK